MKKNFNAEDLKITNVIPLRPDKPKPSPRRKRKDLFVQISLGHLAVLMRARNLATVKVLPGAGAEGLLRGPLRSTVQVQQRRTWKSRDQSPREVYRAPGARRPSAHKGGIQAGQKEPPCFSPSV
jgi:hypothetical protein